VNSLPASEAHSIKAVHVIREEKGLEIWHIFALTTSSWQLTLKCLTFQEIHCEKAISPVSEPRIKGTVRWEGSRNESTYSWTQFWQEIWVTAESNTISHTINGFGVEMPQEVVFTHHYS
jgi:hypothetical protein